MDRAYMALGGPQLGPAEEQDIFSYKSRKNDFAFQPASYSQVTVPSDQFSSGQKVSDVVPAQEAATSAGLSGLSAGAQAGLVTAGIGLIAGIQKAEESRRARALQALMQQRQNQMSVIESAQRSQDRALQMIQDVYRRGLA